MVLTLPVRDVASATPRAFAVRLDLMGAAFPYLAGQAVHVGRPGGELKPYSLATAPGEAHGRGELELLVGLDPSGSPPAWIGSLEAGTELVVDGPHGTFVFPDTPAERRFLFVAGGTGIAPLRAMLHEALARPATVSAALLYSARTADDFAYAAELRGLAAAGRITLWQTVTREVGAQWDGAKGRVALHHLRSMLHDEPTLCFLCGPHGLVREAGVLLAEAGVSPDRVRVEDWGG
jgi:Na+-transporting NADH:ubiquinone oxidoreductase subunit F